MIPFLAAAALKLSPIKAALSKIPRPVWIALAVIAILALGTCAHKRAVKKFGEERYAAGVKHEGDRIVKKAEQLAADAAEISRKAKELNNATNRRIAADADALRVRGPGKAACLNAATPGAGRYVSTARAGNPAGDQVPAGDGLPDSLPEAPLAAVPWPWLVDRAEQCDLNRQEALTWREWYAKQSEAWKKIQ